MHCYSIKPCDYRLYIKSVSAEYIPCSLLCPHTQKRPMLDVWWDNEAWAWAKHTCVLYVSITPVSLFSRDIGHIPWAQGSSQMVLVVKNLRANAGDMRHRFNSWFRKIPQERKWHRFQYSCLENPMDRGAWWATVHRVIRSQTWMKWLSTALPEHGNSGVLMEYGTSASHKVSAR